MANTTVGIVFQVYNRGGTALAAINQRIGLTTKHLSRLLGVAAGWYGVQRALSSVTRAAMQQETAERKLAAALALTGDATAENVSAIKQYAAALQKQTVYGDEEILTQIAYAKSLGLSTDRIEEATIAAMGLATAYGKDLSSAMRYITLAAKGETGQLKEMGIVIDQNLSPQTKYNELIRQMADKWNLVTDATRDSAGVQAQMLNTWGDTKEVLGRSLLPAYQQTLVAIHEWLEQNQADVKAWADGTVSSIGWVAKQLLAIQDRIVGDRADQWIGHEARRRFEIESPNWRQAAEEEYRQVTGDRGAFRSEIWEGGAIAKRPPQYGRKWEEILSTYQSRITVIEAQLRRENEDLLKSAPGTKGLPGRYEMPTLNIAAAGGSAATEIKARTEAYDELLAKMTRENELVQLSSVERARAEAIDQARLALEKDMAAGVALSEHEMARMLATVGDLAAEHERLAEQAKASTIDVAAAYVRMYDQIDSKSAASYEARRALLEAEYREYERIVKDKAALAEWLAARERDLAIDKATGSGSFWDGARAGIAELTRDLPTIGELGANVAKEGIGGITRSLSDAVFEAKDLGDALRQVGQDMARMVAEWAMNRMIIGTLNAAFPVAHGGGVMGRDSFSTRTAPISVFAGAPRFHAGIGPGERPAILRNDEGVFTPGQMRALGRSQSGSGRMESLLGEILAAMRTRQQIQLHAQVVDKRDVVTRSQMEGRPGEQWTMHHVTRNKQ